MLHLWYLVACWGASQWLGNVAMTRWLCSTSFRLWSFSSSFSAHTTLRFKECTDWHGKLLQGQTMWNNVNLRQATLLPLSKFFEATWNLDSFSTSGWKFQQYITCLQNQAKLPCGWDNSLMPLLSHWHTFLKHVLLLWCRMISKPHGLCWIGWMSQLVWLRDGGRKVKSEQWWKVSLSQRVSLMFDCLPISQD